jgi:GAF domain-containing protein
MHLDIDRLVADALSERAEEPALALSAEHVVSRCLEAVEPCDLASISVFEAGEIRTVAATDEVLSKFDALQVDVGEGPCIDALRSHEALSATDLKYDERWPTWGPEIVDDVGVRSVVCFRLFLDDDALGVLTLASRAAGAFFYDDIVTGQRLAGEAAAILATTLKETQLHRALEHRTVIAQATGILIERFRLEPDAALAVMRRISQNHNIKMHDVATHLVETKDLPDAGSRADDSPDRA